MWSPICDWDFNGGRKMKPRICEILGVEVGEPFGHTSWYDTFMVSNDTWNTITYSSGGALEQEIICDIINHPEKIIRKSIVTDEEKEILRAAVILYDAEYISRNQDGSIDLYATKPIKSLAAWHGDMIDRIHKAQQLFEYIKWTDKEPTLISDLLCWGNRNEQ